MPNSSKSLCAPRNDTEKNGLKNDDLWRAQSSSLSILVDNYW